jgi:hypothetical protein
MSYTPGTPNDPAAAGQPAAAPGQPKTGGTGEVAGSGGVSGFAAGLVKLDWIRPLLYKLGGRKVAIGGGALAVVSQIASSTMADWPKAIACLSVALIAALTSMSIGMEDGASKGAGGK